MSWQRLIPALAAAGALGAGGYALARSRKARRAEHLLVAAGLKLEQLREVMPYLPESQARQHLPHLVRAMAERGITTPARRAAYLAQLAFESRELRSLVELASGTAYEGREDLGNTQPGDGPRFKGRGPIQLTGRYNYRMAGRALGVPLEQKPELAERLDVGHRVAAWFWESRQLNRLADAGDIREITRRINGGFNGLEQRERYWQRARAVLGVATPGGVA